MIFISAQTFLENGAVMLDDAGRSRISGDATRATRSQTLDAGTKIVNYGCAHGDKTLTVIADVDAAAHAAIDRIQRHATRVIISHASGLYRGIIKSKSLKGATLTITIWIESRIDEE